MVWQRGQSGNPGGRPKVQVARARAFSDMIDKATDGGRELLEGLLEELRAPRHTSSDRARRVNVIGLLLDRWGGKALEIVDITTDAPKSSAIDGLPDAAVDEIERVILAAIGDAPTEH